MLDHKKTKIVFYITKNYFFMVWHHIATIWPVKPAPILRGLCVRRPSFCLQNWQIMVIYSKIKKCHGLCSLGLGKLMSTCSNLVTIFLISEVEKWEHNIHYPSNINSVMKNSFKHIRAWILLGALFDMKDETKSALLSLS